MTQYLIRRENRGYRNLLLFCSVTALVRYKVIDSIPKTKQTNKQTKRLHNRYCELNTREAATTPNLGSCKLAFSFGFGLIDKPMTLYVTRAATRLLLVVYRRLKLLTSLPKHSTFTLLHRIVKFSSTADLEVVGTNLE